MNKEVIDALSMLLHCALKDTTYETQKEQFNFVITYIEDLEKKLDKAIEMLLEYHMPCEMNDFMNKNIDYFSSNCSVDEEVFKKCWLRYIEQELDK